MAKKLIYVRADNWEAMYIDGVLTCFDQFHIPIKKLLDAFKTAGVTFTDCGDYEMTGVGAEFDEPPLKYSDILIKTTP